MKHQSLKLSQCINLFKVGQKRLEIKYKKVNKRSKTTTHEDEIINT